MKKEYQGYLIDLDGTIYLGNEVIPSGKRFIERLQTAAIPFLFVTNNTTKTPETVADRLKQEFDIHVPATSIYTASLATIDFMKAQDKGNQVYVIGEAGLTELILQAGFEWNEEAPDYVVVGLDTAITYEKFAIAALAIRQGAQFIGTNPDKSIPTERGLLPGAGSFIALLETATQSKAVMIGKPNAIIMNEALKRMGLEKKAVLMVGDNYETDIQSGLQNGIDSLLVLSGFTPEEAVSTLPVPATHTLRSLDEWVL